MLKQRRHARTDWLLVGLFSLSGLIAALAGVGLVRSAESAWHIISNLNP